MKKNFQRNFQKFHKKSFQKNTKKFAKNYRNCTVKVNTNFHKTQLACNFVPRTRRDVAIEGEDRLSRAPQLHFWLPNLEKITPRSRFSGFCVIFHGFRWNPLIFSDFLWFSLNSSEILWNLMKFIWNMKNHEIIQKSSKIHQKYIKNLPRWIFWTDFFCLLTLWWCCVT